MRSVVPEWWMQLRSPVFALRSACRCSRTKNSSVSSPSFVKRYAPLLRSRLSFSRTSPTKQSSPSRMRGCSTNYVSAPQNLLRRWSSTKVISRSQFDLQLVLDNLIQTATSLRGAKRGVIFRRDGDLYRAVAFYNATPELIEFVRD